MSHSATPAPPLRLRGTWLMLARVGWVVGVALDLAFFVGGMPAFFAEIATGCMLRGCGGNQVILDAAWHLHALGLSSYFLAWLMVTLNLVLLLVFALIGVFLFWRRADDPVALLASFTFFTFPILLSDVTNVLPTSWWLPAHILNFLGSNGISLMLFLFPSGRFVPRWTRWVWVGLAIGSLTQDFFPSNPFHNAISTAIFVVFIASTLGAQIYRYRRVSSPIERQQTKLVVIGVTIGLAGALPTSLLTIRGIHLPFTIDPWWYLVVVTVLFISPLLIPLSMALAIQRSHLWEIDTLINRALVYGLLTGLLGALYAGLIVGLESLAGALTGQSSANPLALVVSTLAIVVLVNPLRHRIQRFIDRRFYRRKYDVAKTLAAFSESLRHEVDLEQLREQLLRVVRETTQPASISLWLLPHVSHRAEAARPVEANGAALAEADPR